MTEAQRRERIANGYLWADTEEYLAQQAKVKDLMYEFNQSRPSEVDKRRELMKQMFGYVGDRVWINQPLTLAVGATVSIGEGTYINSGLVLIDDYNITIGKGCLFGTGVTLCTTGHPIDPVERAKTLMYSFPITIGDGAWIGAGGNNTARHNHRQVRGGGRRQCGDQRCASLCSSGRESSQDYKVSFFSGNHRCPSAHKVLALAV